MLKQFDEAVLITATAAIRTSTTTSVKRFLFLLTVPFALLVYGPLNSQNVWDIDGKYLTKNGDPVFYSGVNYVPSHGWLTHLEIWDPGKVEEDMIRMKEIGIRNIRYLPLWPQLQKNKNGGYEPNLLKLDTVISLAGKHGISVQLGLLNSWMSGGTFLPEWADGNMFEDPVLMDAEKALIRDVVVRYRDNPTIQAYDMGNELNVLDEWMHLDLKASVADTWMSEMYGWISRNDPSHLIVNGIGTGFTDAFNIEAISKSADMMATHSYPYFHGTSRLDPWIGQRTTYSTNYIISWAEMVGKPVIMQELGGSEQWMHPRDIYDYLGITMMSNWAEGAAGYLWWCSHDLKPDFRVADEGLFKKYSTPRVRRQNKFSELNYDMGLLTNENESKPIARVFSETVGRIDALGVGWDDLLPTCYILVPEGHRYDETMLHLINAFTLAKQAHMDVKMHFEKYPIPQDADAVVIAGFGLSAHGKGHVADFLQRGGTVYQSFYNDFMADLSLEEKPSILEKPTLFVNRRAGTMNLSTKLKMPFDLRFKESQADAADRLLSLAATDQIKEDREHDTDFFEEQQGAGVLFTKKIGLGNYYFMAADLERSLMNHYGGWEDNPAHHIYTILRGDYALTLDNHLVEFFHKSRYGEEIVVLINHSQSSQKVRLYSNELIYLNRREGETSTGTNHHFFLDLKPAECLVMKVKR